jgi:trk system potassium uptake protein TrkH
VRLLLVVAVVGRLLRLFSPAFVPPAILAIADGEYGAAAHFGAGLVAALAIGSLMARAAPMEPVLQKSEAMGAVAGTWLMVAHFAAIPYVLAGLSPADALFESMSGFTTTGATILRDFSLHGRAFFLWRAMTQWLGGLGVIALFVVVLPRLGIAGRQLFFAEASGSSEAISPRIHENARKLWYLYGGLTGLQAALLALSGMPIYDAVVNSLTTLAAGGFSPHPQSISGYGNAPAEWIFIVFMTLSGTSFTLQYKALTSGPSKLFRDGEFLFYAGSALAGAVALTLVLSGGSPSWERFREGAFQSASLISSTGFASTDYNLWGDGAKALLVLVMLVNGCAGSAAGGAKAIRHLLLCKFLGREITRVLHPQSVIPIRHGRGIIPPPIIAAVITLVILYLVGYVITGAALVLLGADLVTGFSAALACMGNIGPGFGEVGPMGSYADLPAASKLILTLGMWVGRLEIVTVLALFHPDVWRNLRLQARQQPLRS